MFRKMLDINYSMNTLHTIMYRLSYSVIQLCDSFYKIVISYVSLDANNRRIIEITRDVYYVRLNGILCNRLYDSRVMSHEVLVG